MSALIQGFHEAMDSDDYHAKRIGVVSKSALDAMHPTPAHYLAWIDGSSEKSSDAMSFGKAGHCAIFEPDRFLERYVASPDFGDCRFKENKQARDAWRADHADFEHLSVDEFSTLRGIQSSIYKHELVRKLFAEGESEISLVWSDADTGLTCKSRADHYVERLATAVDLKLVEDASPSGFSKSVARYRYHVQDALYRRGFAALGKPLKHFVFVAIEKRAPYASAIYALDSEALERGESAVTSDIATMAQCVKTNSWPGYPAGIQTLSLPRWA